MTLQIGSIWLSSSEVDKESKNEVTCMKSTYAHKNVTPETPIDIVLCIFLRENQSRLPRFEVTALFQKCVHTQPTQSNYGSKREVCSDARNLCKPGLKFPWRTWHFGRQEEIRFRKRSTNKIKKNRETGSRILSLIVWQSLSVLPRRERRDWILGFATDI